MKKQERFFYPVVFTCEEEQEIAVVLPDLYVATSGINEDDVQLSARELLGCVLYGLEERRRDHSAAHAACSGLNRTERVRGAD